jgi:RNA polymerase sigma-70 factor (ECF subfamily)
MSHLRTGRETDPTMMLKATDRRTGTAELEHSAPPMPHMLNEGARKPLTEALLQAAFEAGRTAWPGVKLARDVFTERAARLEVRPDDVAARAADLYLAWACAESDKTSLAYFERLFLPAVDGYVGRLGLTEAVVDDVRQELRIRLLVGNEPRIGQYSGRGPLAAWVRMAAIRVALSLLERSKVRSHSRDVSALGALVGEQTSPELAAVRNRHGSAFQAALERSLDSLGPRDKTLLRMHFIDQLNIEAIGRIYRVHRATVARWLVAIRKRVLDNLRTELSIDLRASTSEFRSMLAVVRADLDLSLRRLLPSMMGSDSNR